MDRLNPATFDKPIPLTSRIYDCGAEYTRYPVRPSKDDNPDPAARRCVRGSNPRKFKNKGDTPRRFWGTREEVKDGIARVTRGGLTKPWVRCYPDARAEQLTFPTRAVAPLTGEQIQQGVARRVAARNVKRDWRTPNNIPNFDDFFN